MMTSSKQYVTSCILFVFRFLAEYGKSLKMLQIKECHQVTEMTLGKLREKGVKMDKMSPPSARPRINQLLWNMRHKLNVQT